MGKTFASTFGVISVFGGFLLLVGIQKQNTILSPALKPTYMGQRDPTKPKISLITTTTESTNTSEEWPYDSPIVEGWPPERSKNVTLYLRPDENTTLISPRLNFDPRFQHLGQNVPSTYLLILCHSSFIHSSFELRSAIRETWKSEARDLPATVVFILGTTTNNTLQQMLDVEHKKYGDILQEDFVDSYNNLTLKSMFMLKYVNQLKTTSSSENSVKFLLKVDDDCYVNIKSLLRFTSVLTKYNHTIVGHVLGENSPVIRPLKNATYKLTSKWEVPHYIYPDKEVFPNALSGSGYVVKSEDFECIYKNGLRTPFLNLEDIFITGLAAGKCNIRYKSSPRFHFLGHGPCGIRDRDILIHNLKSYTTMIGYHQVIKLTRQCSTVRR